MPEDEARTLDLGSLMGSLVDELRASARVGVSGSPEPPSPRPAPVRDAGELLREGHREAVARTNGAYLERAEAMAQIVVQRRQRLEAYAGRERQAVPPSADRFVVAGRVTDEDTGVGLPNVRVRAIDLDRVHDDFLGEARTDALGYYRIEYRAEDFDEADQRPETFIEVLDEEGELLFRSSRSFVEEAGETASISAGVDGMRLPTSFRTAEKVTRTVTARDEDFGRRLRVLERRTDLTLARAVRPLEVADVSRSLEREAAPRPLSEVRGIGATYEARLEREGISDAREVAEMEPSRLSRVLNVSEGRAESLIDEARRTSS